MSDATRRVQQAAADARSNDDLVRDEFDRTVWDENDMLVSPHDKETLDEQASTQMGQIFESRRRDAN
jgi:hypothetical protein